MRPCLFSLLRHPPYLPESHLSYQNLFQNLLTAHYLPRSLQQQYPDQDLYAQLRDISARVLGLQSSYFTNASSLTPLRYGTDTFPNHIHCDKCVNENATGDEWYTLENGYVKTSFKTGEVCLSYKSLPIDEDCYPLVPDDISFRDAMFWYIYKQMLLGGYMKMANKIDYAYADQKWQYYCTQARNNANYPDIDRMESFMNQWVRLIPNINSHSTNFNDLNTRETLYRR